MGMQMGGLMTDEILVLTKKVNAVKGVLFSHTDAHDRSILLYLCYDAYLHKR